MCFQITGVKKFKDFTFIRGPWKIAKDESGDNFEVSISKIPNAGNGVFAKKSFQPGDCLMEYHGEPIEPWYYDAIKVEDDLFTGIGFYFDDVGEGVWRGIPRTLAATINSCMKKTNANVVFEMIDNPITENKEFNGHGFCVVKALKHIEPGDELYLYYGKKFWKGRKFANEAYCAICLLFHAIETDRMLLCDGSCGFGYHQQCLLKHTGYLPDMNQDPWYCFNCCCE